MSDSIGDRGEAIFHVRITQRHSREGYLFRVRHLGEKWQTTDYLVELLDDGGGVVPFFFVQVKATRDGYVKRTGRLKVRVDAGSVARLASYPAPTYIVGIDEVLERAYVVSANGETLNRMPSLTTAYPLDESTLLRLRDEVRAFWARLPTPKLTSSLVDSHWI